MYSFVHTSCIKHTSCTHHTHRGFLWDEGFHQLLVINMDVDLSMAVVASWLDAMFVANLSSSPSTNQPVAGWIPR